MSKQKNPFGPIPPYYSFEFYQNEKYTFINKFKYIQTGSFEGSTSAKSFMQQAYSAPGALRAYTDYLNNLTNAVLENNQLTVNHLMKIYSNVSSIESNVRQEIIKHKALIEQNKLLEKAEYHKKDFSQKNLQDLQDKHQSLKEKLKLEEASFIHTLDKFDSTLSLQQKSWLLFKSFSRGFTSLTDKLLLSKFDPSYVNDEGNTLMHHLCELKIDDIKPFSIILSYKVDIDVRNQYGETALHLACLNSLEMVAKFLIENNADVNARATQGGYSVLHEAAAGGNVKIIELLIQNGANANYFDVKGNTILHYAILNQQLDAFTLLAKFCLEITAVNDDKKGIVDLILSLKDKNLIEFIKICKNLPEDLKNSTKTLKEQEDALKEVSLKLEQGIKENQSLNSEILDKIYSLKEGNELLENQISCKKLKIHTQEIHKKFIETFTQELTEQYIKFQESRSHDEYSMSSNLDSEDINITITSLIGHFEETMDLI